MRTVDGTEPGTESAAGPVTRELAAIWGELLDLEPDAVPPDVSFVRLGGDSVLTVRLSALVRSRLAVELALSDVTVEITLDGLADLVRRRTGGTARALPVDIEHRPDPGAPFPLMPLQQGYFIGQQGAWELSYDSAHFYADVALTGMDGDEAAEALEDALGRLARHQPMLRARVLPDGTQRVLHPDEPGAVPVPRLYDLRDADGATVRATLASVRDEMSTAGPDPQHGPGVDVRLSLLPGGLGRLHTAMSLLTLDGWSATLLNRELLALAADWNAVPAPLEVDFGDYVTAQDRLRDTAAWAADRDWWWARLDGVPSAPALPLRADPRDVRPTLMGTRSAHLSAPRWAALRDHCTARDVTPSAAMLAAFAVVLARWGGHRRMLLNSLQLNRLPLHPDVHRVFGAFAATMLLPVEPVPGRPFAELARDAQRTLTDAAAHNLISGVEVSRELARRRGTTRPVGPVVFQSTLGMDAAVGEGQVESAGPLGDLDFADYYHQLRTPQVALEARFYELHGEMAAVFSLVDELFDPAEVDAAFAGLRALIEALADGPAWDEPVDLPSARDPGPAPGLTLDRLPEGAAEAAGGPPRDDLEQRICALWEDVLGVPVLDRATTFFALGGDSLLAVRALARLAGDGPVPTVREFLDAPTVAGLAASVRARTDAA
ncbi:condensation domain-containing protein [Actinomadura algeriensis]|uniref:Acyl carrier protein n=1 Tax=Actinomadura algeriensis TaxID=1679523 RepID=A0ABR9JR47_9ACTN|nr:condensation domain-containing protein [Actinomadura algeriensis]MBE1533051.1 acyl carrier protein [Actinomadura algeriensis]